MRRFLASVAAALSIETSAAQDAASPELLPRVTGSAEVGIADKYIYHGYVLENQGAIIQPEVEVLARFYSGEGFLTKASLRLYVFSSFELHESRAHQSDVMIRSWYDLQLETGIVLELAKNFTITVSYCALRKSQPSQSLSSMLRIISAALAAM